MAAELFRRYAREYRRLYDFWQQAEEAAEIAERELIADPHNARLRRIMDVTINDVTELEREYEEHQFQGLQFLPEWLRDDDERAWEELEDMVYGRAPYPYNTKRYKS